MSQISDLDLQNLRHLIGGYETTHCKMKEYASQATDQSVKQFFQKAIPDSEGKQRAVNAISELEEDM